MKSVFPLTMITSLLMFQACASSNEVKEIDTKLERKGSINGAELGLNDDNEAIIQEKTDADDELRRQEWANNRLAEQLHTDHYELKRCREDLADERLGGSGEVREIPEIDKMKSVTAIKEDFGLDEDGELRVVRRQKFTDKLAAERKLETTIRDMQKIVRKHRDECDRQLRAARVKAGLPAARYKAKGYFQADGSWVETRRAEVTLDDAFEIRGAEQAAARKPAE